MKNVVFTHHARARWAARFDDLDGIEDEWHQARPASRRVRQLLGHRAFPHIRNNKRAGAKPGFYITRRCVFPVVRLNNGKTVVMTVYNRDF